MIINNLNTKHLIRAHTIIGLLAIFLFYIATYFGTITLFLPYIKTWESPSRYFKNENTKISLQNSLDNIYQHKYPKNIEITLPSFKDKALSFSDLQSKTIYINPNTNEVLNTNNETNFISNFFNQIHIGRNIPIVGTTIMGIASIFTLFLILSGIILWLNKIKTNAKKRFLFRMHKDLSLILMPYFLIFALTGSVLGFMLSYSQPLSLAASKMQDSNLRNLVAPILFPRDLQVKKSSKVQMLDLDLLKNKANKEFPQLKILNIKLFSWGEENAKAKFIGYLKDKKYISGKINRMSISLKGTNAKTLHKKDLNNANTSNSILSTFYFLHFIPDEKLLFRVVYFVFGIFALFALGFGYMIYSQKTAKKYKEDKNYYSILDKTAISMMIGIIPASCFVMFLYWYLPFDMFERPLWLKGAFYVTWAFSLFIVSFKNSSLKAINILLFFSSVFLILTIVFHGLSTKFYPWISFKNSLWEVFFVDISLFIFALIFYLFSKYSSEISFLQKYDGDRYENH